MNPCDPVTWPKIRSLRGPVTRDVNEWSELYSTRLPLFSHLARRVSLLDPSLPNFRQLPQPSVMEYYTLSAERNSFATRRIITRATIR